MKIFTTAVFFLTLIFCVTVHAQVPYKIDAIKAYLYYNQEGGSPQVIGSLSRDITTGDFALFNTIIGEGEAAAPSENVLVVVEISGTPKEYTMRKLKVTAKSGEEIILEKTIDFVILDEGGRYFAPYLLYNTGCNPITITAAILIDKKEESHMAKTIPFVCGE